jgi:hypothetical protein
MNAPLQKIPTVANVWNGREMTHPPAEPWLDELYSGWLWVNCGCCGGLQWGGESPRECGACNGGGWFAVHLQSGRGARWPGGPFNGSRFDTSAYLVGVPPSGGET